jgi:SagB-type dehydrogenase family enzyme
MPFRAAACTGALFHVEEYIVCGDLADLEAGVYHFGAHDNSLRQLRRGDFRQVLVEASGGEPHVARAPAILALTSTWWRNAWKYQARAYRHAFWDSGTILANLLGVAAGQRVAATVVLGFADSTVNHLLDVSPSAEATIALLALGADATAPPAPPKVVALALPTRRLSPHAVDYPEIDEAHTASSLDSGAAAAAWRAQFSPPALATASVPVAQGESIESVILRRGSSRRFSHQPISADAFRSMLAAATAPTPSDAFVPTDLYLIVNAVEGLLPGRYVFNRRSQSVECLAEGDFRREAAFLDLGQDLAGDAALNAYWLVDLENLDDRGYRAAQLSAAIEGGKLYLTRRARRSCS